MSPLTQFMNVLTGGGAPQAAKNVFKHPALRNANEIFAVSEHLSDDEFLDMVSRAIFEFFFELHVV